MTLLSKYDFLNGKELKKEATRRFGTCGGYHKLPINRNQSGYKYRLILIEDDLKKGIDPWVKLIFNDDNILAQAAR